MNFVDVSNFQNGHPSFENSEPSAATQVASTAIHIREIISAEDADVKFIISDHPVTIYNHAVPPEARACAYPNDPTIALKASQTIFPLTHDFCLILTNLEYAQDPSTSPLDKRTFARNYRTSMVRTDAFIRTRKLSGQEVAQVNYVLNRCFEMLPNDGRLPRLCLACSERLSH